MRRRRFLVAIHGMTALAHVVPTLALSALVPVWFAIGLGTLLWLLTARRVQHLLGDPARPRWVTRLVDEPMFWHWGAGMLALPLFFVGGLLIAALSVAGCATHGAGGSAPGLPQAALGSFGAALMVAGYSVWGRRRFVEVRRMELEIAGLHPDLDGYRVVQLSDLHIGSYDRLERGLQWAKLASSLTPDLVLVTGDLVTSGTAYYEDVAAVLGALSAKDGVFAIMGNHDQWNPDQLARAIEQQGPKVLRNEWVRVERGLGALVVAGVDDAYGGHDDLDRTLAGRPEGVPTLLLAHYPRFFAEAARRGVALTLSGHTHGGQFGVPFFADRWNLSSALGQASRGLLRQGQSVLYVNAGLGTTGPPMRLGVAPEIALLVLRAAPRSNMPKAS